MAVWNLTSSARRPPLPRKREIAYKAEIRRPNVHPRFGSRQLRFGSADIVRVIARTTLIVRKSTLVVGKCLDVRRTLRIRVFSSRRRTFNVSFLRFIRENDSWRIKTSCAERAERNKKNSRSSTCLCLIRCEELSPEESWNRRRRLLSLSLTLGKPFVASNCCRLLVKFVVTKPVLDLPIAFL